MSLNEIIEMIEKISPLIIVALISGIVGIFSAKINRGSKSEIDLINELQEENKARKEENKETKAEIKLVSNNLAVAKDYVEQLRKWISKGSPPPPPPYPPNF